MKKFTLAAIFLVIIALSIGAFIYAEGRSNTAVPTNAANPQAILSMPTVFSDGMVFQRNAPINVFGYSKVNGATVEVTLGDASASARVSGGKWSVTLPAMEAMRGLTLTVSGAGTTLTFSDVDIGEIWVISGQSNAVYELWKMKGYEDYLLNADNFDNIRVFTTPKDPVPTAENQLYGNGRWYNVDRDYLKNAAVDYYISSVGYVMATRLAAEFGSEVTVAIMNLCVSGTGIETWLDPDTLGGNDGATHDAYVNFYEKNGRWPESTSDTPYYKSNIDTTKSLPGIHYTCQIGPYEGFRAGGVIWYQGESNMGTSSIASYPTQFNSLKSAYRSAFANPSLPFFVIQLQPYLGKSDTHSSFRAMQNELAAADESVYIIAATRDGGVFTTNDIGYSSGIFVHNSQKEPIGLKLADAVLDKIYSVGDSLCAPEIVKAEISGRYIILTFDSDIELYFGDKALGFEIGMNGSFDKATAVIDGNKITLSNFLVSAPTEVRYGFGETTVEHESGERMAFTSSNHTAAAKEVKITHEGENYVYKADSGTALSMTVGGNITNATGAPLPVFILYLK